MTINSFIVKLLPVVKTLESTDVYSDIIKLIKRNTLDDFITWMVQ